MNPLSALRCRSFHLMMASLSVFVLVASNSGATSAEGRPPLPPEAYAACDSKHEGDACSVVLHDRDITGTCAPDGESRLFCRLSGPPPVPARSRAGSVAGGDASIVGLTGIAESVGRRGDDPWNP